MTTPTTTTYCPHCGETEAPHAACDRQFRFDPPRYCPECRRRMVVRVTPAGWAARCSAHGETTSA